MTFLGIEESRRSVLLDDFAEARSLRREVPVKVLTTADGKQVTVTTVYDLLMAQYGVPRGLDGDYPADYNDADAPYTPAWQERFTGLGRKDLLQFAREWASTAEHTGGKCMIIIGAGINHWYHGNLMYRAGIHALMFCGCVGKNGSRDLAARICCSSRGSGPAPRSTPEESARSSSVRESTTGTTIT